MRCDLPLRLSSMATSIVLPSQRIQHKSGAAFGGAAFSISSPVTHITHSRYREL